MQLPESLSTWRPRLDWLKPELAPVIEQMAHIELMVRQLDPLIGPLRGVRQAGMPEPEGLSDLSRRGPYERLLYSEWLLADDAPDEFLRRAASGEHLFLAPRPRAHRVARQIIALFDTGPLQLGAPRLAHIAMWILLARRAAEAKAEFLWGTLQTPGRLRAAAQPNRLNKLLSARTYTPANAAHTLAWREYLAQHAPDADELWRIGIEPLPEQGPQSLRSSHIVTVQRTFAPDALAVTITDNHRQRTVSLPLPNETIAARILKGEFLDCAPASPHKNAPRKLAITRPPVLSPGATHVAVSLLGSPDFHVYRILSKETTEIKPKLKQLPKFGQTLALSFRGKDLGALLSVEGQLRLWNIFNPATESTPRAMFQTAPGRAGWSACAWVKLHTTEKFYALDDARNLVCWNLDKKPGEVQAKSITDEIKAWNKADDARHLMRWKLDDEPGEANAKSKAHDTRVWNGGCEIIATDVLGLMVLPGNTGIVYAQWEKNRHIVVRCQHAVLEKSREYPLGPITDVQITDAQAVHFIGGNDWTWRMPGCAVLSRANKTAQDAWHLFVPVDKSSYGSLSMIRPPQLNKCIGLARDESDKRLAFVALSSNGLDVMLVYPGHVKTVFTSPSKILHASIDPHSGLLAMLTAERDLIVYSPLEQTSRLFVHGKAEEA